MDKRKIISIAIVVAAFLGCASQQGAFETNVQLGMDKSEVLELIGGPSSTRRRNGEDVWQYDFYSNDQKSSKELRFKNNKVSYKGDPILPKAGNTAKEVDSRNAKLAPSFEPAPTENDGLTPQQRRERLDQRLKEDLEEAKKPNFKEL